MCRDLTFADRVQFITAMSVDLPTTPDNALPRMWYGLHTRSV